MEQQFTDSRLANLAARAIYDAFCEYQRHFKEITQRAKTRFETQDWHRLQGDAVERLELHRTQVEKVGVEISQLLGERVQKKLIWTSTKAVYSGLITSLSTWELAETFFNSVTRRMFPSASGVDPQVEFVDTDFETPPQPTGEAIYRTYSKISSIEALIENILLDQQFAIPYQDLQRDTRLIADQIRSHLQDIGTLLTVEHSQVVKSVFYRRKAAYLVGQLFSGSHRVPLVLALMSTDQGIVVDAVLLNEDDVSVIFSFARSYFLIDVDAPYDVVQFLSKIMPRKPISELYNAIGHNKHGKTELYRERLALRRLSFTIHNWLFTIHN